MLKRHYSIRKESVQKNIYSGEILESDMPRLSEVVSRISCPIKVTFWIEKSLADLPELKGEFSAQVEMQCQRCLDNVEFKVDNNFHFYVSTKPQDQTIETELDVIPSESDEFDVISVIEDEILIHLPLIPKHEKNCNDYLLNMNKESEKLHKEIKTNPFEVLKGLKTNIKH